MRWFHFPTLCLLGFFSLYAFASEDARDAVAASVIDAEAEPPSAEPESAPVNPLTPQERGLLAFTQEYAASHGYVDFVADLRMELVGKNGRQAERRLRIQQMESADRTVRTMVVFDEPKGIRGTGLLTHSHILADDDQWLFLPALRRVKKISSRDRSGPFVGSTFAYEDLADHAVEEFTDYLWLRSESCGEWLCDVVERTPKDEFSGYSKHRVWIDQAHSRVRQAHYFDEQGALLKQLSAEDFRPYEVQGRTFHQPHLLTMTNVQSGRVTRLVWESYQYEQNLVEARDFSTNALRRVR